MSHELPFDAAILDGLLDPVLLVDQGQIVVGFNRAARQLFGDNALNAALSAALDNGELIAIVDETLNGNPGSRNEISLPYPISRTYELNVWRLPDLTARDPVWAMVVLHDVTASKKAAEMRADFVANVSHELRSPLSSLLGFIETLRGPARDDPKAAKRFLEIMESEAQRMTRLINDLLALSKVETDEHIQPVGSVNLKQVINQVRETLSVRADERGMCVELDLPDGAPLVFGDADELTQVGQNLIANAISYGHPETSIKVIVRHHDKLPADSQPSISLSVINTGDGIPADDIPRLTERFYRVDKGRSRNMGGTGLGLAIVKHIVARHRGRLEIESVLGGETTFTVHLPSV